MSYKGRVRLELWHIYSGASIFITLAVLFPRFEIDTAKGSFSVGHAFFLVSPYGGAHVDVSLLLTTIFSILLVTVLLILAKHSFDKLPVVTEKETLKKKENIAKLNSKKKEESLDSSEGDILDKLSTNKVFVHTMSFLLAFILYGIYLAAVSVLHDWAITENYFELSLLFGSFKRGAVAVLFIVYTGIIGWYDKPHWLRWTKRVALGYLLVSIVPYALGSIYRP